MDGHGQPALLYIVPFTLGNIYVYIWCISLVMKKSCVFFLNHIHHFFLTGTFITLGKKRGDLKILWYKGEPERVCPHVRLESSSSSSPNRETHET